MNKIDYINSVVGKPWQDRCAGPDAFDCWGLVVHSFKIVDGVDIEQVDGYTQGQPIETAGPVEVQSGHWQEIQSPEDGSVFCAYESNNTLSHVGRVFVLAGGGPHAIHARGTTQRGQVTADHIRIIERFFDGRVKYFKRVQ